MKKGSEAKEPKKEEKREAKMSPFDRAAKEKQEAAKTTKTKK